MITTVLVLVLVVGLLALALTWGRRPGGSARTALDDAEAEARRWYERLGGQVLSLSGRDDASRQALADAAERYTAAGSQLVGADSGTRYRLAGDTALEGLYYVRAARTVMGMDPGPELPDTDDRRRAGSLTEQRRVEIEGREVTGSPTPDGPNSHYYPGGTVGGRPVPAGWYSEPWWKPMLLGGVGAFGGMMMANALFSGFGGGSDLMAGGVDGAGLEGLDGGGFDFGGW